MRVACCWKSAVKTPTKRQIGTSRLGCAPATRINTNTTISAKKPKRRKSHVCTTATTATSKLTIKTPSPQIAPSITTSSTRLCPATRYKETSMPLTLPHLAQPSDKPQVTLILPHPAPSQPVPRGFFSPSKRRTNSQEPHRTSRVVILACSKQSFPTLPPIPPPMLSTTRALPAKTTTRPDNSPNAATLFVTSSHLAAARVNESFLFLRFSLNVFLSSTHFKISFNLFNFR